MLKAVRTALVSRPPVPTSPRFVFEFSRSAAEKNGRILQEFDWSLERALASQALSPLGPGSEFRRPEVISRILGRHPLWPRIESLLVDGSDWALEGISESDRAESVKSNIERGNHKSASDRPEILRELMLDDVAHGFTLPVPLSALGLIPGTEVAPMGIAAQSTINEWGEIVPKDRPTHDLSFQVGAAESINDRIDMSQHQPCRFGHAFRRCITYIVDVRRRHPSTPILGNKVDLKSAYRRLHLALTLAAKNAMTLDGIGLISLRLTFGGRANPSEFCNISEALADLTAAILACRSWDPDDLHSEDIVQVPETKLLPADVPFAEALPLSVTLPVNDSGVADAYIDDIPTFVPDLGDNRKRGRAATLLAISALERPVEKSEPLPRDPLVSGKKLRAEGGLAEEMVLLGWHVDTRRLLVSLPVDKHAAWCRSISVILNRGETDQGELSSLVGRLNHVAYIIPSARHFMSRLRELELRSKNRRTVQLPDDVASDLRLWLRFLDRAAGGISMNLLSPRAPSHEYLSDASEHGLGGFSLSGRAWRLPLPEDCQGRLSLNMLEFIAAFIGPWIDIIEGTLPPLSCCLAATDSTTAERWLRKSNFRENLTEGGVTRRETAVEMGVKRDAARKFASLLLDAEVVLYSQWFQGKKNVEADSLSRDTQLSDLEQTNLLSSSPLCQLPTNFRISPVPSEIVSWVTSLARRLPVSKQINPEQHRSDLFLGTAGSSLSTQSGSAATPSSSASSHGIPTSSSAPSRSPSAKRSIRHPSTINWLRAQSEIPSATYVRPSGSEVIRTLEGMPGDCLASFYSASTAGTQTKTPGKKPKRQ